jgi:carboxypeptidase family protein
MTRSWGARLVLPAWISMMPALAVAQTGAGSIAGTVKDATGAVLPGVTVEASSPSLIEKVRTVVTDGEGQYKIVELRPGTYTVTFTVTGFNTVILVDGYQSKDGSQRANGRDVTLPDGQTLFLGSSGTGAPRDGRDPSEKK